MSNDTALLPALSSSASAIDTIPQVVKAIRKHYNWSQRQLAQHMGVSNETVSRWEKGEDKPKGFVTIWLLNIKKELNLPE